MTAFNYQKYRPFAFAPVMHNRDWVNQRIEKAPIWCSVDLRDGNQALIDPMNVAQKLRFWQLLLNVGFKEIETGFPSASQTEFDFHRQLIEKQLIPDDVTIQVLVQAREHLIEKTFEALKGVKRAIVHVYNSTSKVQREKAFEKSKEEIKQIAMDGAQMLKTYAAKYPETEWIFQYSPESFSQTEPDYAVEVVEAVCRVWQPEKGQKVIINLPATVEAATPNVFADQVEYFCKNLPSRRDVIISLHTHNDRGTGVAAAELGLLAGADRLEGTLLGNGERTGNMDIVTVAMNLYSQGINPMLDFADMNEIVNVVSSCNNLPVHPRHPYVGDLVFTAFSGSHQDAIKKCLEKPAKDGVWDIAYLPIDPQDIGRSYQDVVRINSQSGKGGVAYVLQRDYDLELPRWMQIDFSKIVQTRSENTEKELSVAEIWQLFEESYMQQKQPFSLKKFNFVRENDLDEMRGVLLHDGQEENIRGSGNGTITAFVRALETHTKHRLRIQNYAEHALSAGTRAEAMAYVQVEMDGKYSHAGAGKSHDTVTAMLNAVLAATNALLTKELRGN